MNYEEYNIKYYYLLFFTISICITSVSSETLLLKNGDLKKGKVIIKTDVILMTLADGQTLEYPRRAVLKILFRDDLTDAEIQKIRIEEEAKLRQLLEKKNQEIGILNAELQVLKLKIESKDRNAQEELEKKLIEIEKLKKEIQQNSFKEGIPSIFSPMWRSAIIPGWGHIYLGNINGDNLNKSLGFIYGVSFIGSILYNISVYSNVTNKKDAYISAANTSFFLNSFFTLTGNPNAYIFAILYTEPKNNAYSEAVDRANQAPFIILGVYLAQIVHSFVSGGLVKMHENEFETYSKSSWNLRTKNEKNLTSGKESVFYEIGYSIKF